MRQAAGSKAEGRLDGWGLGLAPFGHSEDGEVVTQEGGDEEGEEGGEGEVTAWGAAGIGDGGAGGDEGGHGQGQGARGRRHRNCELGILHQNGSLR